VLPAAGALARVVVSRDVTARARERGMVLHIRAAGEACALACQTPHAPRLVLHGAHLLATVRHMPHDARHVTDALGPGRPEPGHPGTHDQRVERRSGHNVSDRLHRLDVWRVLTQRVLTPVGVRADDLWPRGRGGIGDHGATVMRGCDDTEAACGHEPMIHGGRALLTGEGEMRQERRRGARTLGREGTADRGFPLMLQGASPASPAPEAERTRDQHGEQTPCEAVTNVHLLSLALCQSSTKVWG
jgi:hypothetical protein